MSTDATNNAATSTHTERIAQFLAARLVEDQHRSGMMELAEDADPATLTREQNEVMAKVAVLTVLAGSLEPPMKMNPKGSLEQRIRFAFHEGEKSVAEIALKGMTLAYADHQDFREEWRP